MRISYKTHPILEKVHLNLLGQIPILETDAVFFQNGGAAIFVDTFKRNNIKFNKQIVIISQAFTEAAEKAADKLINLYKEICIDNISDIDTQGVFVIGQYVFMITNDIKKDTENQKTTFLMFNKDGCPIALYEDDFEQETPTFAWISNLIKVNKDEVSIKQWIFNHISSLIVVNMFKTYAEVETKFVLSKSKEKDSLGRCLNETNLNLTYLDSKWFTNLVKSQAFTVNGHFRLQPKKINGEWSKELTWIEAYEKQGYTSKARITSDKNVS